jgi:hypothetical protein
MQRAEPTAIGMSKTAFHVLLHEPLAPKTALLDCQRQDTFEHADLDVRTSKSLFGNGLGTTRHRDSFVTFQYLTGAISDKVRTR